MGVFRRVVLPLVLLALTAAGLMNTYGDSTNVERLAAEVACGGKACPVQMTEFTRSPFAQDYVYVVKNNTRVAVKCQREMIFIGEYRCRIP